MFGIVYHSVVYLFRSLMFNVMLFLVDFLNVWDRVPLGGGGGGGGGVFNYNEWEVWAPTTRLTTPLVIEVPKRRQGKCACIIVCVCQMYLFLLLDLELFDSVVFL